MRTFPRYQLIFLALTVILVDQATKWWAVSQDLATLNTGISFSFLAGLPQSAITALIFVVGILMLWSTRKEWHRLALPLTLIFSAGFSNLLDRLKWGGVVDFLPVPILQVHNNLADWVIVMGLVWLVWLQWRDRQVKLDTD